MEDIFYRVYADAIKGGIVGDMGAERWQTLSVLAAFMDEEGRCFPSQDTIAEVLGVSRETANRRIRNLTKYTWQGKPIVTKYKARREDGCWDRNIYKIDTSIGIKTF